jgi:uncharacterized protein
MWFWLTTGSLGAAWLAHHMYRVEPNNLEVTHRTLALPRLPSALEGLRLLHVSDLHLSRFQQHTMRFLEPLRAVEADLILFTGDLIESNYGIELCRKFIDGLEAPYGKICVLGNHDYFRYNFKTLVLSQRITSLYNDWARLERMLGESGCLVLRNASTSLEIAGERLWIAGVDDPVTDRDDLGQALAGVPAEAFVILLAHTPDILEGPVVRPVDLCLAGHTHGGQIRLPLLRELVTHSHLRRGSSAGAMDFDGQVCHISRGLGVSGLVPVRLLCRPEAAVLTLRRGVSALPRANRKRWSPIRV